MANEKIPTTQIERIKQIDRIKPSLFLNEKDCPDIKKMRAGQEYDFIIHAKMTSDSRDTKHPETGKNLRKPMVSGRFEILSIESPGDTLDDSDFTGLPIERMKQKSQEY